MIDVMMNMLIVHYQLRCIAAKYVMKALSDELNPLSRPLHKIYLEANEGSSAKLHNDHPVSIILKGLLNMSITESHPDIKSYCASALGEIGAIDPLSIHFSLNALRDSYALENPPWTLSRYGFGLRILEHHLVPALSAADSTMNVVAQDRTGFAVQEILKELANNFNPEEKTSNTPMPEELIKRLQAVRIYDTTEPYWKSRYELQDKMETRKTPLYHPSLSYERWIGLWIRYLISRSSGVFRNIFVPCRGTVRSRSSLGQFLLPYLVVDYLIHNTGDNSAQADIVLEITHVIGDSIPHNTTSGFQENVFATKINTGSPNDQKHMSIQTILNLLETLESWTNQAEWLAKKSSNKLGTENKIYEAYEERRKYRDGLEKGGDISAWPQFVPILRSLLNEMPLLMLGQAAQRIGAHARALKYFEIDVRERHRKVQKDKVSETTFADETSSRKPLPCLERNDGSNKALPHLTMTELAMMQVSHAALEDTDSVHGLMALKQLEGQQQSPETRAMEMEHVEDWQGALYEYSAMLNRICSECGNKLWAPSSLQDFMRDGTESSELMTNTRSECSLPSDDGSGIGRIMTGAADRNMMYKYATALVGSQRCLLEMGHLDVLIDQVQVWHLFQRLYSFNISELGFEFNHFICSHFIHITI